MISELRYFLDKHYRQLPGEAGQQLMLYIALVQRFCNKYNIRLTPDCGLEGLLPKLFYNIPGYEIKDAAITFDASMPWSIIHHNPSLLNAVNQLNSELSRQNCATSDWLRQQADILFSIDNASAVTVTPESVRRLIAKMAALKRPETIVDICSGTFALGLQVWNEMKNNSDISCIGEELNSYLCAFSRLFLFLCGVSLFSVSERNVMGAFKRDANGNNSAKVYLADFPLTGSRTVPTPEEILSASSEPKSSIYADWFMIQQTIERMNDGDRAFLLVTKGALVRKNEYFLRKKLVEQDWLDAVIQIPSGISHNHNLPMELLVCEKNRAVQRRKKVLFADLSCYTVADNEKTSELSAEGISETVSLFKYFTGKSGIAKVVESQKIQKNEYSLYPPVYLSDLHTPDGKLQLGEIAEVIRGIQNISDLPEHGKRYFLNIRDIQNGTIHYDGAAEIEIRKPDWEQKYRIQEDDIIITCRGAALKIAIVPPDPPPAYISGNLAVIRVKSDEYPPYLLYEYLISDKGQRALELIQTGTTIRVLGIRNIEQLAVPRYNNGLAAAIGDSLKLATVKYRQSAAEIEKAYNDKKNKLLKQIEENGGI